MQASQTPPPGSAFNPAPGADNPSPDSTNYTVFFSASNKDYEWRDRIKAALSRHPLNTTYHVEMWPDSIVPANAAAGWGGAIEAAINRASVAVIMLSPDYLASTTDVTRSRLFIQRRKSNLQLFPIVVRECDWRNIPELGQIQVWRSGQAIGSLPADAQQKEFDEIAQGIFELMQKVPNPVVPAAENSPSAEMKELGPTEPFSFSKDAEVVALKARELMKQGGRNLVTPSCLLMAIAYDPNLPDASRQFLRTAIDRAQGFETGLQS